ncbi:hypothetical protein [Embleya sp. NPDC020886]|uniref:hypothetical protein n=1 Tax=Embleya sp. NPDC020886 TaxID=3363980 RepID=UPI0037A7937B
MRWRLRRRAPAVPVRCGQCWSTDVDQEAAGLWRCHRCRYEWGTEARWRPREVLPLLPPTAAEDRAVVRSAGPTGRRPVRRRIGRRVDPYDVGPADGPETMPGPALDAYEPAPLTSADVASPLPLTVAGPASRILDHLAAIALDPDADPVATLAILRDTATALDTVITSTTRAAAPQARTDARDTQPGPRGPGAARSPQTGTRGR